MTKANCMKELLDSVEEFDPATATEEEVNAFLDSLTPKEQEELLAEKPNEEWCPDLFEPKFQEAVLRQLEYATKMVKEGQAIGVIISIMHKPEDNFPEHTRVESCICRRKPANLKDIHGVIYNMLEQVELKMLKNLPIDKLLESLVKK